MILLLAKNTLIVAQGQDHPLLYTQTLFASQVHWINKPPQIFPYSIHAKTRYRQADQACIIHSIDQEQYRVDFTEAQRAVTPGQSVVFYEGDVCLGGGIISSHNITRGGILKGENRDSPP